MGVRTEVSEEYEAKGEASAWSILGGAEDT